MNRKRSTVVLRRRQRRRDKSTGGETGKREVVEVCVLLHKGNRGTRRERSHWIKARWTSWKGELCGRKINKRRKGTAFKLIVVLHGGET